MRKGACPILNSFIERLILYASLPVIMADDDTVPKYSPDGLSHDSAEEDPFENARKAGKVNLGHFLHVSIAHKLGTLYPVSKIHLCMLHISNILGKLLKYVFVSTVSFRL